MKRAQPAAANSGNGNAGFFDFNMDANAQA